MTKLRLLSAKKLLHTSSLLISKRISKLLSPILRCARYASAIWRSPLCCLKRLLLVVWLSNKSVRFCAVPTMTILNLHLSKKSWRRPKLTKPPNPNPLRLLAAWEKSLLPTLSRALSKNKTRWKESLAAPSVIKSWLDSAPVSWLKTLTSTHHQELKFKSTPSLIARSTTLSLAAHSSQASKRRKKHPLLPLANSSPNKFGPASTSSKKRVSVSPPIKRVDPMTLNSLWGSSRTWRKRSVKSFTPASDQPDHHHTLIYNRNPQNRHRPTDRQADTGARARWTGHCYNEYRENGESNRSLWAASLPQELSVLWALPYFTSHLTY